MKILKKILLFVYLLLLYYLIGIDNKLLLTINFGIGLLIYSLFCTTSIKNKTINKKFLFKIIISLLILSIPLMIISYLSGNIMHIKYLNTTNLLCVIFIITNIMIKLICEYLNNKNILNIHNILTLFINIILVIIFKSKYNILYLHGTSSILFIILLVLFIIKVKNKKTMNSKINIKDIIITNKEKVFINFTKSSYIYTSIIILYYLLINKYTASNGNMILSNSFFFGIIFMYIIYYYISKFIKIDYSNINNFNSIMNKILDISLYICIPLMIISTPVNKVIFNSSFNFIFPLFIILFFYLLFDSIINICINNISNKKRNISLIIGFIIKLLIEIPLINASFRMGYDLSLGSILSISLGLFITFIINIFFIVKKYKINLLSNFSNILNIIYTNIIYLLVLVLCTLIIKVDNDSYIINILIIFFYLFISIVFRYIIKKYKLTKI